MNIRIEKIAKELLMEEDCVVIPNFGGFVTHYRAAMLEPSKNILIPPGKSISFNSKLSKNDGLLAQNIAVRTGLTYNEALKAITTKVAFWEKELNESNFLELDGLGSFVLNKEGNLIFEQFNESNFANSSFGLTNVHATPIERVGLTQRIERSLDKKKASPKTFRVIARSAVAVCLLGVLGFGSYQVSQTETGLSLVSNISNYFSSNEVIVKETPIASNNIELDSKKPLEIQQLDKVMEADEKELIVDLGLTDEPEDLAVIKEIQEEKKIIDQKFQDVENQVKEQSETLSSKGNYHIIAGCFGVKSNARKMVRQLKRSGFSDAQLAGFSKSGLHRVAYGSYNQKVAALKALAKAKLSHNSAAWMAED